MTLFANRSPVKLKMVPGRIAVLLAVALASLNCNSTKSNNSSSEANGPVPVYGYQIVKVRPHDPDAFTQGLEIHDGKLYESTGEIGRSSLRLVDLENGDVVKKVEVPPPYFAEGVSALNGKLYQLTWQHQVGFTYDPQTLEKNGQFNYQGEGWGLTNDGRSLIISNGTNRIKFLDPVTFQVTKTIAVFEGKQPIEQLNELEYINGELYANVWHADRIAIINPDNGRVKAWLDLRGLLSAGDVRDEEAVLNGIAYDAASDRLFVTGKLWPKIFEIKVKK
jgi:glutamine cyclotransferase